VFKTKNIIWLFDSMGYGNNILYWGPLLKNYLAAFPDSEIHTCNTEAKVNGTNYKINKTIKKIKILGFFCVPSFSLFLFMKKKEPRLLIVNEFGWISIYSALYRVFTKKTRLLLLVENDPVFLNYFYNKKRRGFIYNLVRRLIANTADAILCNNSKAENYLSEVLKVERKKIICGCYLTSQIKDIGSNKDTGEVIKLLFVGRLIRGKGVQYLIEALKVLPRSKIIKIKLDIVGDGPYKTELEKKVREGGLNNTVRFHGAIKYESIGRYFTSADVFILPTLGDYRALVGFEALSCGLAIIGSVFDGASEEVIENGKNGFVIDPLKIDEFASKIDYFICNPSEMENFKKKSKSRFSQFDINVASNNLIKAVSSALN
jgi:glycosyltransferase involved in cell wall biosynthesis